jgi:hypothetical protein
VAVLVDLALAFFAVAIVAKRAIDLVAAHRTVAHAMGKL